MGNRFEEIVLQRRYIMAYKGHEGKTSLMHQEDTHQDGLAALLHSLWYVSFPNQGLNLGALSGSMESFGEDMEKFFYIAAVK